MLHSNEKLIFVTLHQLQLQNLFTKILKVVMDVNNPPPLEDMTPVLKKMHLDIDQQSTEINSTIALEQSFQENVQKKNIRRTKDKKSLVLIETNKHVLITNGRPQEEASFPSKSKIKPFKKGFLNAIPKEKKTKSKPKEMIKEKIPFIKPKNPKEQHDNIPDFMRVQNSEQIALQKEVREMLQPTQELVRDVMETTDIRNGLEDPEIMAAVSDIAENPEAMHKYKHNKKISTFYNHLGILMKDRIDKQENRGNSKNEQCKMANK